MLLNFARFVFISPCWQLKDEQEGMKWKMCRTDKNANDKRALVSHTYTDAQYANHLEILIWCIQDVTLGLVTTF